MPTILVPLDFSDATPALLRHASKIANSLGAKILLLHVVEPIATSVPVGASMDVLTAPPPIEPQNLEAIEHRLRDAARDAGLDPHSTKTRAILGIPVDDIIATANDENADFIALASHGHGALYHLFSGSVVTGVLKRASCPVIVIPAQKKE